MKCPLPKCFRHKFVTECKPMIIGQSDEAIKQAAFTMVDLYLRFAAPFESLSYETPEIERRGEKIGKYKVTVEKL